MGESEWLETGVKSTDRASLERSAVGAVGQQGSVLGELCETSNGKILLVGVSGSDKLLRLLVPWSERGRYD